VINVALTTPIAILICGADDRDDMVAKAEGWALRALSPWDPAAVVAFLERQDVRLAPPSSARSATSSVREEVGLSVDQARVYSVAESVAWSMT
jgi:3-methyladenine DNA glycosylase AlkD